MPLRPRRSTSRRTLGAKFLRGTVCCDFFIYSCDMDANAITSSHKSKFFDTRERVTKVLLLRYYSDCLEIAFLVDIHQLLVLTFPWTAAVLCRRFGLCINSPDGSRRVIREEHQVCRSH